MVMIDGKVSTGRLDQDTDHTPVCVEVNGWTPILDGDVYCSPLCGCKCKKADYDAAVAAADAAVKELGEGWKARVSENTGWHGSAVRGKSTVYIDRKDGTCWCSFDSSAKQYCGEGPTPTVAVEDAMRQARADIVALEREMVSSGLIPRMIAARDDITDL